ncbi:MAG TPA: hypothetical protein VGG33_27250 [Polyangia bacterium]
MAGITRRKLFRRSGALLALPLGARAKAAAAVTTSATARELDPTHLRIGRQIYESIGVRPVINCRGTFTIIGGSLELPEVRAAKEAAADHFVHMDELMEAIGRRLATLTGAGWGIVTSGCAAAITHATVACVAGANPDRHVRLPSLEGFPKDEVIIPRHSRNLYDAAVRSVGVKIVEVDSYDQLQKALGPRVAMIYFLANDGADNKGSLSLPAVAAAANAKNVPVLVDAAAEILSCPNVHLQAGATLVGYSGGKCLRGPQCAGLLLGRKDLVRAAWVHSAPHHGFGRAMKVGKEEAVGMLAAVEAWKRRDHEAEWARWVSWLEQIAKKVTTVKGVTATIRSDVARLSDRTPTMRITWDRNTFGLSGAEMVRILFSTEPRIVLQEGGGRGRNRSSDKPAEPTSGQPSENPRGAETGISITAYMMQPGDARVVANRLHEILSDPRLAKTAVPPLAPAADLSGSWDVDIDYIGSQSRHALTLKQSGGELSGKHQGDFVGRDISGNIDGDNVRLQSRMRGGGLDVSYGFTGKLDGTDRIRGEIDLGEYLTARWTARRTSGKA